MKVSEQNSNQSQTTSIQTYKRVLKWEDGIPRPTLVPLIPKKQQAEIAYAAASAPYMGRYDTEKDIWLVEERFQGMTQVEVMWCRIAQDAADGDKQAAQILLDRTQGKPKQSAEIVSVSVSYTDFLKQISDDDDDEEYIDVEVDVTDGI